MPEIDYDQLARQFGGSAADNTQDFDALASEYGGAPARDPNDVTMRPYLRGATGISATPWYSRPLGSLSIPGLIGPGGVAPGAGPSVVDVIDTLPAIGGALGGALGFGGGVVTTAGTGSLPMALSGAALGGSAGEGARQNVRRVIGAYAPRTSEEAARGVAIEGATQAAAELGGRGLAAGAKAMGRGMVENAVRPPIGLQREFPGVVDTIVRERLPVGAAPFGTIKGSQRAAALLKEESASVRNLLAKATAGGTRFETSKLAEPVLKLLDEVAEQPLAKSDMLRLEKMLDEFTSKKGPLSPLDVQKLKQSAQAIAKPIYKAIERGEAVTADQALLARFNGAIATGAKEAMETIPGIAEGEARKQALIGARKALSQSEMRRLSLMAESVSGSASVVSSLLSKDGGLDDSLRNGVLTWAFTRGILSPRSISRTGLALTSSQAQAMLRQFPRLGLYVLSASPEEEEPRATEGR